MPPRTAAMGERSPRALDARSEMSFASIFSTCQRQGTDRAKLQRTTARAYRAWHSVTQAHTAQSTRSMWQDHASDREGERGTWLRQGV
eukprot:2079578-Rhodomonas_salina.2